MGASGRMNIQGSDSAALAEAVYALMEGMGRGGLTCVADRLGMSASAMRKRFLKVAFDEPTMRATLLIGDSKDELFEQFPIDSEKVVGSYLIRVRSVDGEYIPTWRVNAEA